MRGHSHAAVAVRRPNGTITTKVDPVGLWAKTRVRRVPFARGILILAESLTLGMGAIQWSANVALEQEGEALSRWQMTLVVMSAVVVAALVFFATPALLAGWLEDALPLFLVHLVEGAIRITFLLAYLWFIGRIPDVRRLFAYHGAEHKTIHAFEAGVPLDVQHIQQFSPAHPRCGTSFLLMVMVVSIFVFALLGQPPLEWKVLSRILLLPVVAAVSYEALRFGAGHLGTRWVALTVAPGLTLQRLTTREPEDDQVEVALTAFTTLLEHEPTGAEVLSERPQPEINA